MNEKLDLDSSLGNARINTQTQMLSATTLNQLDRMMFKKKMNSNYREEAKQIHDDLAEKFAEQIIKDDDNNILLKKFSKN